MKSTVLDRLRTHLAERAGVEPALPPPATEDQLVAAEAALEFLLPAPLRALYSLVANGGFGPAYGLIGVQGGATDDMGRSVVDCYRDSRQAFGKAWPDKLLLVCHYGCGIYACADGIQPEAPVVTWHPADVADDKALWRATFTPEAASLEEWVERWFDTQKDQRRTNS